MKQRLNTLLALAAGMTIENALTADIPSDELQRHDEYQDNDMQADANLTPWGGCASCWQERSA